MAAIDPFASVAELCSVSSSQDEYLRRCRFALEPLPDSPIPFISDSSQDAASADLRLDSTPIRMESLPETPVEENQAVCSPSGGFQASGGAGNDHDSDKDTVVIVGDSTEEDSAAVDLSRDTYPLFSLEPSTGRIESQDMVILCNSEETRVLDGELGFGDGGVCESLITPSKNPDKVGGSGVPVSEKNLKGLTRCLGLLPSSSETREGSSSCSRTPLLRTPQSDYGSDPALVVQRSIMSLEKLGSPLKGLTTASEKQGGNFSKSMFLQTSQANSGVEPAALVLQRSLKSLEKMGSTTKERKQGPKSVQAAKGLASAVAIEHTADRKSEAARQGSAAKRKLEFVGEGLDSNAAAETNVVGNVEHMTTSRGDPSLRRSGERAKEPSGSSPEVAALLGFLEIFAAKDHVRDSTLETMSLIDICKMRGMTFP